MTKIDKKKITEPYALVIYAPDGEVEELRIFRKTLLGWREFKIFLDDPNNGVLKKDRIKDMKQGLIKLKE